MTTATATRRRNGKAERREVKPVRCAIYTRKSTEEGLDQDFNTLDAQRSSAEAFIQSRKEMGWVALPDRYDDGGFTGANMKRPALTKLLSDMAHGHVDCVIVYKVDRLSRSLLDFARLMSLFEEHEVAFVSVTQNFDTSDSVGRLLLNILFSFAQFERETIADRTRDKMRAARRKGKWTGGYPVLGYDLVEKKLVVNEEEAEHVREIFRLYLALRSVRKVVREINSRGWTTKSWTRKDGSVRPGKPFSLNTVSTLLQNPTYIGKVRMDGALHEGEQGAVVDQKTWERVQALLERNVTTYGTATRNRHGALLRGLLRCASCDSAMIHTYTKKPNKLYRYYVCSKAQKKGWKTCPTRSVSAAKIEQFVVEKIRGIGKDPALLEETVQQIHTQAMQRKASLAAERKRLQGSLRQHREEIAQLAAALSREAVATGITDRITDVEVRMRKARKRLEGIDDERATLETQDVDEEDVTRALSAFGPVWDALFPAERERIIQLVIRQVDYDGKAGIVSIALAESGIATLARELARESEEAE